MPAEVDQHPVVRPDLIGVAQRIVEGPPDGPLGGRLVFEQDDPLGVEAEVVLKHPRDGPRALHPRAERRQIGICVLVDADDQRPRVAVFGGINRLRHSIFPRLN
jgi:hypothetical protein